MKSIQVPAPEPAAQTASARLAGLAAQRIRESGGWIGFDAWMAIALYEPGLGYYSGGARKFGAGGDFVTAPEISPLFGACLASQCLEWFDHAPACVHEFGAGSGALAADLLLELEALGAPPEEYLIVEVSGALRERQRETIARRAPQHLARVRWLDTWPQRLAGVVLANELLDAMPARAFRLRDGQVFERGVALADPVAATGVPGFRWDERPADAAFEAQVRGLLARQIAEADVWPDDYQGEVAEQACAWVREAGHRLERGAILLVDYGFPGREFYHPQRGLGTLMCHYRHHAHGDPFLLPGLQDITVHVDFTAVAEAATAAGLETLGYASQARLLINLGLLDRLAAQGAQGGIEDRRRAQAAHTLLSEAEMGELFKAIAFGRQMPSDPVGFARGDRSGSL